MDYDKVTIEKIRNCMIAMRDLNYSWEDIGHKYLINRGLAWAIVNKHYDPKDSEIRIILGLPELELTPVCPTCGIVHVKNCPVERQRKELTIEQRKINVLKRIKKAVAQAQELGLDVQWSLKL